MARKKPEPEVNFLAGLGMAPDPAVRGVLPPPRIDPSVAAAHEENVRRDRLRRMTKAQRRSAARDAARAGLRMRIALSTGQMHALRKIAVDLSVPMNNLVAYWVATGMNRLQTGDGDLRLQLRDATGGNVLRFRHELEIPDFGDAHDSGTKRIWLELPADIVAALRVVAQRLDIPMTDLVVYWIASGVMRAEDLRAFLQPAAGSNALRYDFQLTIPPLRASVGGNERG